MRTDFTWVVLINFSIFLLLFLSLIPLSPLFRHAENIDNNNGARERRVARDDVVVLGIYLVDLRVGRRYVPSISSWSQNACHSRLLFSRHSMPHNLGTYLPTYVVVRRTGYC